ncbi:hypothetical protein PF005_g30467 [Phytophthora fragariae]|uniref:Uncharacterized protein n=2 Tax=Phytophthora TaxID=4783 RepID=A0A6A3J0C9_9STRA|nr:hypothetical protein PF011_g20308 [Phytophthora fragariae]KAE8993955.1 hypothetical protein PR002_g20079 [Phytophthora rubi]KAE9163393.1 hypothetical protein PF005_g30467 [Phytophthora fragariae]KAE9195198.1 hypothetical protein PF002_g23388 [Phytophthora fragariae]
MLCFGGFGSLPLQLKRMEQQPLGDMVAVATLSLTITEAMLQYVFVRAGRGGLGGADYGAVAVDPPLALARWHQF